MHGDQHEGGVAAGDEDVDRAVIGHAENAAHVRQHEETTEAFYDQGTGDEEVIVAGQEGIGNRLGEIRVRYGR